VLPLSCLQERLPVGPFDLPFQVQLSEVEERTGLMWDEVVRQSEVTVEAAAAPGEAARSGRRQLRSGTQEDVVLWRV
jgi:hypothetical protein